MLRAMRADMSTMKDDLRELNNRVGNLEVGQANILQQMGHQASMTAQQQLGYDRLVERVEPVEKLLNLQ